MSEISSAWFGTALQIVKQRKRRDRGVAVVATFSGVTYDRAAREFDSFGISLHDRTTTRHLKLALTGLGLKPRYRCIPIRKAALSRPKGNAILCTEVLAGWYWHRMVWDYENQKVLDPLPPPLRRPRIRWY